MSVHISNYKESPSLCSFGGGILLSHPLCSCTTRNKTMDTGEIWDVVIFILCVLAFVVYHVWYFLLRGTKYVPYFGMEKTNLWYTGLKARSLWAHIMMRHASEGLAAVHTVRNLLISVSLLAAAEATLVVQLLSILTDPAKIEQIEEYAVSDPITSGNSFMSASTKVAIALGDIFLSLLLFVQCVRISVHLGFLIRVVPENLNTRLPLRDATIVLTQRTTLFFSLGIRFLFGFVPLAFYMTLGTLALLISTVLLLLVMLFLDVIPSGGSTEWLLRTASEAVLESSVQPVSVGGGALPVVKKRATIEQQGHSSDV